ncbi:neuronal membrane glycoprotein M6-b-like isoform X1 [Poeciliopsis prolifica]|uniref:neuronal membrane glycoprotein M6-b-like isoform X1 n=1 Tax=Poeciliopsis prolifica TaxID=188132 RepID=UPI0024144A4B|nr:neuronal membrane glycoprotein M6-b-like isoform X1 [Poeciliopsis prolifica]
MEHDGDKRPYFKEKETIERRQRRRGCFECCIKCLGGVPYASLVATILCFSGVALFCGCGHVALTGTLTMLENHFSRITSDHATLAAVIQIFQYIIYGIASFFFIYAILLLGEGFYTTSAIKKELQSDFKTTICGRCITAFFMFLTYIFALVFIAIFCFTAIPVFLFFNMWNTCAAMRSPDSNITYPDSVCVDVRQYGVIPLNATPGKACGTTLTDICSTSEFYLSYHLYIVALAGAGATVIALIHYLMILAANWAYLKTAASTHDYQDIKTKDDQDLEAEARSKDGQNSSSYS